MSFDDYVNHIRQKYRLAIAIAIIKSKPDNKTTEDYIKELKQKVNDQNMDSDDLDITLCSDDFNIDNDGDATNYNDKDHTNDMISDNNRNDEENHIVIDENDLMDDNGVTNDSITILNDFEDINDVTANNEDNVKINEFPDVFRMLTEDGNYLQEQQLNTFNPRVPIQNDSQITYCNVDLIDNVNCNKYVHDTQISDNNSVKTMNKGLDNTFSEGDNFNKTSYSQYVVADVSNRNIAKDIELDKYQKSDIKDRKIKEVNTKDSQETIIYTLYGLTQNNTHVSQSQNENFMINDKFIHGIDMSRNRNENFDKPDTIDNGEANTDRINDSQNDIFTQNAQRFDTQELTNSNGCNETEIVLENEQVAEEDLIDSQVELIPFKVIEELSKVKGFLNRKFDRRMSTDGFSTDSGYKSDSQLKNSGKSGLQLSATWVNQSAYCLFNFITICPLIVKTQDINNEISMVLGQLIDKLHEDEKYPSFLEELLEFVDLLLRRVYEEGGPDNGLLKKDETIQRLLLLNKSKNIQKFCIEKITDILNEAHTNLMKDEEQFEIIQINKIENLSYIFHILEIILKRHVKCRETSTQNSQMSQEDDILKKSSITDMWRKKWNPNYKEICVKEGSLEKKCVLVKCSEVLNKIIVNCMESYSLVAYEALQSFNLLQS